MNRLCCNLLTVIATLSGCWGTPSLVRAESIFSVEGDRSSGEAVHFDMPPVAAATATKDAPENVTVELRLSSMIVSPEPPRIDQWLVRCQPRDRSLWIVDYAPRTETSSDVATPIQIKKSDEEIRSMGVSLDGVYGHLARANAAADQTKKSMNSVQFDHIAPVHAVTASGTINRGRGVYFKLRWTAQQILEGEKTFRLTLNVPKGWRGSLIDVSVVAQGEGRSFAWERETKTIGSANFVVAAYRSEDPQAEAAARTLAEAEFALRAEAVRYRSNQQEPHLLPSMLRHFATKLELESEQTRSNDWLQRVLTHRADPHLDKQIRRLPMPLRVAILDYADCRDVFLTLDAASPAAAVEKIADHPLPSETHP